MSSTDFDDEARKLIAELSKSNSTDSFSPLDAIWQNKDTGAKVFIGNIEAARNKDILKENNVSCVVNCQDLSSPNFHEDDPSITYFRFPVAHWYKANLDTPGSTVAFFEPVFRFIDSKIAEGRGMLSYQSNLSLNIYLFIFETG
eukprot:GSMAST32.ASY1.ANO1.1969.1 assembled CDS